LFIPIASRNEFQPKAETDTTRQRASSFFALPFLFYLPETKLGGGAMAGLYFREPGSTPDTRPSSIAPKLVITQEKQFSLGADFDLYFKNEKYHLLGSAYYEKFPGKFYGVGNNTSEANEEKYTPRGPVIEIMLQRRIVPGWNSGMRYEFVDFKMEELEENGLLAQRTITGSEGGKVSGIGWLLNWDTRDNVWYPSAGGFHQLSISRYDQAWGSDFEYHRLYFDARFYRRKDQCAAGCCFRQRHVGALSLFCGGVLI
jgi:hypothetical protein